MVIIPFESSSFFSVDVTLDGEQYTFIFAWNTIYSFWYMDILDTSQNVLIAGIKLCPMQEVLSMWVGRGLPPGKLYVMNVDNTYRDISFDDFYLQKTLLVYIGVGE